MEEQFINIQREYIKQLIKESIMDALHEELPKILDGMAQPGKLLSDFVDYDNASKRLGVTKATLHNYINAGKLTKHYVIENGKPFLKLSEIEAMIKKTRRICSSLN